MRWTFGSGRLLLAIFAAATGCAAHAQSIELSMSVGSVNTGTFGIDGYGANVSVGLTKIGGTVLNAPLTFKTTLPTGLTFAGHFGGNWACSNAGPDPQLVTCTYSQNLTTANPNSGALTIYSDVAANLNPPGDQLTFVGRAENAQVPPSNTCGSSPSATGCVQLTRTIVHSQLRITSIGTNAQPFMAGDGLGVVIVNVQNIGYGPPNTPVTMRIHWPPGMTADSRLAGLPTWNCSFAQAQTTVCTTPAMFDSQTGFVSLRVNTAANVAVPGPVTVTADIANNMQAAPSNCASAPTQLGCGQTMITTQTPPQPNLAITSISHGPVPFAIGQNNGPLTVNFTNSGLGAATPLNLQLQLPPGFAYQNVLGATPNFSCTASGNQAQGQTVRCSAASLGASTSGSIGFNVHVGAGLVTREPGIAVVSLDAQGTLNPAVLVDCASTPELAHCEWHAIPVAGYCRDYIEGIYCDGYEAVP